MTFEKAFSLFKYSVYALLAVNVFLFFLHATFHEGMDSMGWIMLLAIFEWETRHYKTSGHSSVEKFFLLSGQIIAYCLVLYAWGNYYLHDQWLDFVNASLWLGVIMAILADLYWDGKKRWRAGRLHHAVKIILYAGLVAIAIIWGMQGDILNFYDAFLWIVCFFAIELNLLHYVNQTLGKNKRA